MALFLSRVFAVKSTTNLGSFRRFTTCSSRVLCAAKNCPPSGDVLTRSAGIASMMRLPIQSDTEGLDACFVGVPMDIGTSNRSGTRFGPRQIRTESVLVRSVNYSTGASPYESLMVADVGDIPVIPYNAARTCEIIKKNMSEIIKDGCKPLTAGGDHLLTYPVLQAMKEKYGKVGLIHVDAHSDTDSDMMGEKLYHGVPFYWAAKEGALDCDRVVQIGLRGSVHDLSEYDYAKKKGFRLVFVEECWHKSLVPLMAEVRQQMGDGPVYVSFDIDALDPAFAPGTGTPEIGGLTSIQGIEIIRGCRGLNIVGGDVVEVSPPYDPHGTTALVAANLLFEMLCVLPGVKYQ